MQRHHSAAPGRLQAGNSYDLGSAVWLHRFALCTAGATLLLIFVGGLVTSTGSGLAVPDWPLSFGQLFPPMVGGVFYEHGHRMVAATVGVLTVVLAVWMVRREPRAWLRWLAVGALSAIIVQGLLGGLTVLLRLPTAVSVLHASLAQLFFCAVVTLAVGTGPWWRERKREQRTVAGELNRQPLPTSLFLGCALTTLLLYGQIVIGAVMRHLGAGLAIPDFPLAFGRLIPPLTSLPVTINFLHRAGAVTVALAILLTVWRVIVHSAPGAGLRGPAWLLLGLLGVQFTLGAATILTVKAVTPTTLHVAGGAALLATSLVLTLRSYRLRTTATSISVRRRKLLTEQVPA